MNQEEVLRALEVCIDGDSSHCDACPLEVVPGCMHKLLVEARKIILSMLEKKNADAGQEPELWTRQRVLRDADRCVCGQREHDYGGPEDSFRTIANLWTAYMTGTCGDFVEFSPVDVSVMLGLLKVARIANNPKHMDNWVDLAGYAACGGEIAGKE